MGIALGIALGAAWAPRTAQAQATRRFEAPTGMIFNYIRPTETDSFEQVMMRVGEALQTSDNAARVQQAEGWHVYRAREPGPSESVLYVWFLDPTVPAADYAVSQILNEAFPTEVQALYEQYSESFVGGQVIINLDPVVSF